MGPATVRVLSVNSRRLLPKATKSAPATSWDSRKLPARLGRCHCLRLISNQRVVCPSVYPHPFPFEPIPPPPRTAGDRRQGRFCWAQMGWRVTVLGLLSRGSLVRFQPGALENQYVTAVSAT